MQRGLGGGIDALPSNLLDQTTPASRSMSHAVLAVATSFIPGSILTLPEQRVVDAPGRGPGVNDQERAWAGTQDRLLLG